MPDAILQRYKVSPFTLVTAAVCIAMAACAYQFYLHGGLITGHVQYAKAIETGKLFIHPAFGIFWLASLLHHLTSLPLLNVLYLLLGLHVALTLCVIMWVLKRLMPQPWPPYLLLLTALGLMVVSPIGLPFVDPKIYNFWPGNRSTLLLRNATYTAVLPYVIAAFGLLAELIRQDIYGGGFHKKTALLAGGALFLSSLVKPSFAVSIIPTLALYMVVSKRIAWKDKLRIASVLIPTCCVMLGQIYIGLVNPYHYVKPMLFLPWATWSQNNIYPLPALVLAICFPIFVCWYRRKTLACFTVIAWINLGIALIPYIFFAVGERDLEWPYLHARMLLFLCAVIEWSKWRIEYPDPQPLSRPAFSAVNIAGVLLVAHIVFGVARLFLIDRIHHA